jgi:hypothetical protein
MTGLQPTCAVPVGIMCMGNETCNACQVRLEERMQSRTRLALLLNTCAVLSTALCLNSFVAVAVSAAC